MRSPLRSVLYLPLLLVAMLSVGRLRAMSLPRHFVGRVGAVTRVDSRVVLRRDVVHEVVGSLQIDAGGVLVIEAGTRVEAHPGVAIDVSRGGRIEAEGTLLEPIEFTCHSVPRYPGCWDGLRVRGSARINFGTPDSPLETGGASGGCLQSVDRDELFGGCSDASSSGVLRHARIEYAAQGVALFGVGSGTTIDALQVNRSAGDGLRVIGGAVNLRRLFLTANGGFGLAWRAGWRGQGQFIVVQQDGVHHAGGVSGSNAGADNGSFINLPRSAPTLFNLTIIAPATPVPGERPALYLREGTGGVLRNVLVHSSGLVLDVDQNSTCTDFGEAPRVSITNLVLASNAQLGSADVDPLSCEPYASPDVEAQWLQDPANGVRLVTESAAIAELLRNPTSLSLPDLRPAGSSVLTGAPLPGGGFFDAAATYIGAVTPMAPARNNIPWYAGWTTPAPPLPAPGQLAGTITATGVGPLAGVIVTAASGQTDTTDVAGAYALTLPAGTHRVTLSALPLGCSASPITTAISSATTSTGNVTVGCTFATDIAVGALHACLMADDRRVQCWGQNDFGMVGDGSTVSPRVVPVLAAGGLSYDAGTLTIGYSHSCASRVSTAYCWGLNVFGVLGFGSAGTFASSPVSVGESGTPTFSRVFAGGYHACGLTPAGETWCWGWNAEGQVGANSAAFSVATPTAVAAGGLRFQTLALGESHTCGLTTDGAAYCWGGNARGESGRDTTGANLFSRVPSPVNTALRFAAIDAGTLHTCALTADGQAFCWGAREYGQLGDGTTESISAAPVAVNTTERFARIAAGSYTTCGVTLAGRVFCWGRGLDGALGNGTLVSQQSTPVEVMLPRAARTIDVSLSEDRGSTACVILVDGRAFCWGRGDAGQLGNGIVDNANTPVQVRVRGPS
jgi:alpha-tubulin suppressor-like RCC1 family protein